MFLPTHNDIFLSLFLPSFVSFFLPSVFPSCASSLRVLAIASPVFSLHSPQCRAAARPCSVFSLHSPQCRAAARPCSAVERFGAVLRTSSSRLFLGFVVGLLAHRFAFGHSLWGSVIEHPYYTPSPLDSSLYITRSVSLYILFNCCLCCIPQTVLTFWRRNYFFNFSTPCI